MGVPASTLGWVDLKSGFSVKNIQSGSVRIWLGGREGSRTVWCYQRGEVDWWSRRLRRTS